MAIKIKILKRLEEITRYEKETGKKYDITEIFRSKITDQPTDYAFSMISIPKIGINPQTSFNTPAGIYCYPLDQTRYDELIENELPFVSDNPYVGLIKLNWDAKWLILSKKTDNDKYFYDLFRAKKFINHFYGKDVIDTVSKMAHHWEFSDAAKIFDIAYFAAKEIQKKENIRFTIAFARVFKDLGYDGIYDDGNGILHGFEDTQLVCLTPKAYTPIGVYETTVLRANSEKVKSQGEIAKDKGLKGEKDIKFWKRLVKLPPEKKIIDQDVDIDDIFVKYFDTNQEGLEALDGATFNGHVSALRLLPPNIKITKRLYLQGSPWHGYKNIYVNTLVLVDDINKLSEELKYKNLDLNHSFTHKLPEGFKVEGDLIINYHMLSMLPENLDVGGELKIIYPVKEPSLYFPKNFKVGSFSGQLGNGPFLVNISFEELLRNIALYRK